MIYYLRKEKIKKIKKQNFKILILHNKNKKLKIFN